MNECEIDRHIIRAVYELDLIKDEYSNKKINIDKVDFLNNTIEMLYHFYPKVKEEIEERKFIM